MRDGRRSVELPPTGTGIGLPDNIVSLVAAGLARQATTPVIVFDDGVEVTGGELRAAIERLAGWLAPRVHPGGRVLAMLTNRAEMMVAWIATASVGGVLVSLNHAAGEVDAAHVVADAAPGVAIAEASTHERLIAAIAAAGLAATVEVALVEGDEPFGLWHCEGEFALELANVHVEPALAVNTYYTSGTTGLPKGCVLGHDYWLWFVHRWLTLYGMGPRDRLLCCLQFFYGDPPWQFLASLHVGVPWVVMRRFSVSRFWDVVRTHQVTHLFTLASIPALLATAPPSPADRDHGVRLAVHIGVPPALHGDFVERWGFPWLDAYGLTESGLVAAVPPEDAEGQVGTGAMGVPVPGAEIRLVDPEGNVIDGTDQAGEVWIRAPGMFQGYLGRPEATAEAFSGEWLRSGDLAWRDSSGYLHFAGRAKDVVRRSGENVSATEVEQVLQSHPRVLEAAVVAVPDDLRGEEVMAYVAYVEGSGPHEVPLAELAEWCEQRLAPHKVPRFFQQRRDPFEHTPSMRIKKADLPRHADSPLIWDREDGSAGQTLGDVPLGSTEA